MEERTLEEVIQVTADMLRRVNVPASLIRQIGEPVAMAIENLQSCIDAIQSAKREKADEEEANG